MLSLTFKCAFYRSEINAKGKLSSVLCSYLAHFSVQAQKIIKIYSKKICYISLYFEKWNVLALALKKLLHFLKKGLSYISGNGTFLKNFLYFKSALLSPSLKSKKNPLWKSFLYFLKKAFLIFQEREVWRISYIPGRSLQNLKIKNFTFFVCWERAFQT